MKLQIYLASFLRGYQKAFVAFRFLGADRVYIGRMETKRHHIDALPYADSVDAFKGCYKSYSVEKASLNIDKVVAFAYREAQISV